MGAPPRIYPTSCEQNSKRTKACEGMRKIFQKGYFTTKISDSTKNCTFTKTCYKPSGMIGELDLQLVAKVCVRGTWSLHRCLAPCVPPAARALSFHVKGGD